MRDHGLSEGLNSELFENACHVSQTVPSCTSPAHLLHKFLVVTHSEDDPWHTSPDILPAGQRHRLFQVPGTSFRFLLSFNFEGNIARVQPGSPETAQGRSQGSQEPGESPCASRRLPERLPESSPGGVLKKIRTQLNQTALRMVNLKPLSQVAAIRALFGLCHEKEEPEPRRRRPDILNGQTS